MKNAPENPDLQGENMVFLGTVSKLQFFTSFYIINSTGYKVNASTQQLGKTKGISQWIKRCEVITR